MSKNYVMSCGKDEVYLSRDKANCMYLIEFRARNPKIRMDALLTFDIYRMMYELNKDLFESHHIVFPDPSDPSRAELLFISRASWAWARDTRTCIRTCRIYPTRNLWPKTKAKLSTSLAPTCPKEPTLR